MIHQLVLNLRPLDWKSRTLTSRLTVSLFHLKLNAFFLFLFTLCIFLFFNMNLKKFSFLLYCFLDSSLITWRSQERPLVGKQIGTSQVVHLKVFLFFGACQIHVNSKNSMVISLVSEELTQMIHSIAYPDKTLTFQFV